MRTPALFAALALVLGVASPGAGAAQTLLKPGDSIAGALTSSSDVFLGTYGDCYLLDTTPGSRWIIGTPSTYDSFLRLGVGDSCADATWIRTDDDSLGSLDAQLTFNAGGGTYVVLAQALYANVTGTYTINVRQEPGDFRRGMMVPGRTIVRAPEVIGAASTVDGPPPTQPPGEVIKDCPSCPQMVVVPAGSFMMGSPASEVGREPSEGPRHLVTLARAFAIGAYEVTFDEYDACVAENGCRRVADNGWGRGRRPVVNVSYNDAQRYVAWLSQKTGQRYFLPTESEWEYAARAGTDTPWNTGSAIIADDANILNQFQKTVVVGGYPSNAYGLYDTHGNASEWTQDCMDTGYVGVPADGSAASQGDCAASRVVRGGSLDGEPVQVRSASRYARPSNSAGAARGLRVTRAL